MNYISKYLYISLIFFCTHFFLIFSMDDGLTNQQSNLDCTVYIKNSSEYPVRISVGPCYPSSIALYPEQILDLPLNEVSTITASSYGKIAHYISGVVAELNISGLLQENPDQSKDLRSKNLFVNITYKKGKVGHSLWDLAKYLFTQNKWDLSLEYINSDGPIQSDYLSKPDGDEYNDSLYDIIVKSSESIPEQISRDATFIWSMFPRAASKIVERQPVYPFNVLGLDIGGLISSDEQLRNWGNHLYKSLNKRFSFVSNDVIGNAVKMIITDSVEALKNRNYYANRDPGYPVTLLYMPNSSEKGSQEPSFPVEIIGQLKAKMAGDKSVQVLLDRLKLAACEREWFEPPVARIPTPPPLPVDSTRITKSHREKSVIEFMQYLERRHPEEETLLDKVTVGLFEKIDNLNINYNASVSLKYAILYKLTKIEQNGLATTKLNKIQKFMTDSMLNLASSDQNPVDAMQKWISRLACIDQSTGFEYKKLDETGLLRRIKAEEQKLEYQASLMAHLRQQIRRFEEPEE